MEKTDYTDPVCPFDFSGWTGEPSSEIPVQRVIEKEDELLAVNDYEGAVRMLKYWVSEAEMSRDVRGLFAIENELTGVYRKMGLADESIRHGKRAVSLTKRSEIGEGSVSAATAMINLATALKAFGRSEEALPLYGSALQIYEKEIRPGDGRLGGLYNNYALALADVGRFEEAGSFYEKAVQWMGSVRNGALEQAMTYLNLCDLTMAEEAEFRDASGKRCGENDPGAALYLSAEADEKIQQYLDLAWDAINDPSLPGDGYYAFVAETSAGVFEDYGRKNEATALKRIAEEIRESLGNR